MLFSIPGVCWKGKQKWKAKNTTLSEQFQYLISKIIERGKIDTPKPQIHDCSLSWLGTDMNYNEIKLIVCDQTSSISEMLFL
jgi:hypothetical protein